MCCLILVAGLPATGKTSFAKYLSKELCIPMVSKDILKEFLFDTVGFKNRKEKVAIAIASITIMNHFAEAHLSVGNQRDMLRKYAKEHSFHIYDEYVEMETLSLIQ